MPDTTTISTDNPTTATHTCQGKPRVNMVNASPTKTAARVTANRFIRSDPATSRANPEPFPE